MINSVRRAYFNAKVTRNLFIELPRENKEAGPDKIGKLNLCQYGARDAATNWQETLSKHLIEIGFIRGAGHHCVFYPPARGILTLVHGDDYAGSGKSGELDWLEGELEKQYEIKTQRLGWSNKCQKEGKVGKT